MCPPSFLPKYRLIFSIRAAVCMPRMGAPSRAPPPRPTPNPCRAARYVRGHRVLQRGERAGQSGHHHALSGRRASLVNFQPVQPVVLHNRSVYVNSRRRYLYYWHQVKKWIVGENYQGAYAGDECDWWWRDRPNGLPD